mmetsp:Transcript_23125/g.26173  ORF Transcript_23125/g.26173 Transcript_23125/m.26173 type:complete len:520 (+) Transcript_23125:857-2416(+)
MKGSKLIRRLRNLAVVSGVGYGGFKSCDDQTQRNISGVAYSIRNATYASVIVSVNVADYIYGLKGIEYNTDAYHEKRSIINRRVAKRILWLSEKNRGIYLKAGQYLGNLDRIMPREYIEVLKVLQDSGPSIPFDEISVVLKHDLHDKQLEIASIDENAIAAASLAQVHAGYLKDGTKVAIKLQFPFLQWQTHYDLIVLAKIASFASYMLRWYQYKNMDLLRIFNTFKGTIIAELDFTKEVDNAEKTRALFGEDDTLHVPEIYPELSSRRVITMEFIEGIKINDIESFDKLKWDKLKIADMLVDAFAKMIFMAGHIHCDAHPGNILVRKNPHNPEKLQIVLLDHGLYQEISDEFRLLFCELWKSIITFDYGKLKELGDSLGLGEYYRYLPLLLTYRPINSKKPLGAPLTAEDRKLLRKTDEINFEKVNELIQRMPPEIMFIMRASNLIAIHNAGLGGNTRGRLKKFSDYCFKALAEDSHLGTVAYLYEKSRFYIRLWLFENFLGVFKRLFTFHLPKGYDH